MRRCSPPPIVVSSHERLDEHEKELPLGNGANHPWSSTKKGAAKFMGITGLCAVTV
jgi:hypothetical protein